MRSKLTAIVLTAAVLISQLFYGGMIAEAANAHTTVYNGTDYSAVYDYNYYVQIYRDVAAALGYNDAKILEYFVTQGMNLGHVASPYFDINTYRNTYGDLQAAFGANNRQYYMHYIQHGRYEGRNVAVIATPLNIQAAMQAAAAMQTTAAMPSPLNTQPAVPAYTAPQALQPTTQAYTSPYYSARAARFPKAAAALGPTGTLKDAFRIAHSIPYFGHNDQMPSEPSWPIETFADYGFTYGKGNCYVMAAMFYEMAYVLGFSPRQISGYVASRKRGWAPHSWIEMSVGGVDYIFDPNMTNETGRDGFMKHYGDKGTWKYNEEVRIQMPHPVLN